MQNKILIAGYYGYGNAGDEAILASILQSLRLRQPGVECVVVSGNPDVSSSAHGIRSLAAADILSIIEHAMRADLIILGGGGLFHDYWGCPSDSPLLQSHQGIPFCADFPLLAAMLEKPCMIYAVGIGPLFSKEAKRLTRISAELADVVTVRDHASAEQLRQLGVSPAKCPIACDPVFGLRLPDLKSPNHQGATPGYGTGPLIGVCPRFWEYGVEVDKWQAEFAGGLERAWKSLGGRMQFIPFQENPWMPLTDDGALAQKLAQLLDKAVPVESISTAGDYQRIVQLLRNCDCVIGMRLHSIILAACLQIPVVAVSYDPKVHQVMKALELEDYSLSLDRLTCKDLERKVVLCWENQKAIRETMFRRSANFRALADQQADMAIALVSNAQAHQTAKKKWFIREFAKMRPFHYAALTKSLDLAPANHETDQTAKNARSAKSSRSLRLRGSKQFLSKSPRGAFAGEYVQEHNAQIVLYTNSKDLFPQFKPRRDLNARQLRQVKASLIATVRNEKASINSWLESLLKQTRLPDEVVVADSGSVDGTVEALEQFAADSPIPFRIIKEDCINIAQGRNLAISQSRYATIACADFGCSLHPEWLENLLCPFEDDPDMEYVGGWYQAMVHGKPVHRRGWPTHEQVHPQYFIPSSRSLAFTKSAWRAVGTYPEWLTLTGEDTFFALQLKKYCRRAAFVPDAVVAWDAPSTPRAYWQKIEQWSRGDGEIAVNSLSYWNSLLRICKVGFSLFYVAAVAVLFAYYRGSWFGVLLFPLIAIAAIAAMRWVRAGYPSLSDILWESGAAIARVYGFRRGAQNRALITDRRHHDTPGVFFILSGIPIDDTGGGARCAQLAIELLTRGFAVVFINRYPKYESTELHLKFNYPKLYRYELSEFLNGRFLKDYQQILSRLPAAAIVEFPLMNFLPLIHELKKHRVPIVYDLLDDWASSLGGDWYSPDVEMEIIRSSELLIATARTLRARLENLSQRQVLLLPNAYNSNLFDRRRSYAKPPDWPAGEWFVIYVGAVYGDWFDWELLVQVAKSYSDAGVIVIGDYRQQLTLPSKNLHFLGLKAQQDLPAYLSHADVAILPWKVMPVTHATSPLKVYEYLAMGKPVVAPQLDALEGIPNVITAGDGEAFTRAVGKARGIRCESAILDAFLAENSWASRISTLLNHIPGIRDIRGICG